MSVEELLAYAQRRSKDPAYELKAKLKGRKYPKPSKAQQVAAYKRMKSNFTKAEKQVAAQRGATTIISRLRKTIEPGSNPDKKLVAEGTKIAIALTNLLEQLDDDDVGNVVQLLMKPKPTLEDLRSIMKLISIDAKLYRKAFPTVARQLSIEAPPVDVYPEGKDELRTHGFNAEEKRLAAQRYVDGLRERGLPAIPSGWVDELDNGSESKASFHTALESAINDDIKSWRDEYEEPIVPIGRKMTKEELNALHAAIDDDETQSQMEDRVARENAARPRREVVYDDDSSVDEVAALLQQPERKRSRSRSFLDELEASRAARGLSATDVQLDPELVAAAVASSVARGSGMRGLTKKQMKLLHGLL